MEVHQLERDWGCFTVVDLIPAAEVGMIVDIFLSLNHDPVVAEDPIEVVVVKGGEGNAAAAC